jgi:CRISPR-associated endonuclease/helicase Cas3
MANAIAHAVPDGGPHHRLDEHLQAVARLAATFATDPTASQMAALAGLWHDLGKYRPGFQKYIHQVADAHIEGRVPDRSKTHSAAGALWAEKHLTSLRGKEGRGLSRVLQYVIAGHHAGLDNWEGGLKGRLISADAQTELAEAEAAGVPADLLRPNLPMPGLGALPLAPREEIPGRFALWLRMLFSALVDADFLDTEAFMSPAKAVGRQGSADLAALLGALDAFMAAKTAALAAEGRADSQVNRLRAQVLLDCRTKAECPPGTFTLSVPTGGGKTLASMAFALTHAVRHGKRRVVVAIPYTSIIEQTADVYRTVFASVANDVVVEHHSNAESAERDETSRSRLACENWDAPIVVTTNVQLFESLFARRTSRCRKLHNLAHSVLVIDEAQLLPVEFLQPCVDVLRLLVRDHGVTVVLCTATQPTLTEQRHFGGRGLRGYAPGEVTAIIDDEAALYAALKRVRVHLPADLKTAQPWDVTAQALMAHEAALAIVGRRADARALFEGLKRDLPTGAQGLWHLSALMCAQHRSEVIADIKAALVARRDALARGEPAAPVRVVSTQLVEAGVDLDFPVVFRALAGLDSIAQAAGRCNREGHAALGDVFVFVPPKPPPPGLLRQAAQSCSIVWHDDTTDPLALERIERYFAKLYGDADLDKKKICDALRLEIDRQDQALAVRFRDASDNFKLIDDKDGATVIVHYQSERGQEDVRALIGLLERDGPERWLMRKLQRYGVTVYRQDLQRLVSSGDVRELPAVPGLYVQNNEFFYDPVLGAQVSGAPGDPESYIC